MAPEPPAYTLRRRAAKGRTLDRWPRVDSVHHPRRPAIRTGISRPSIRVRGAGTEVGVDARRLIAMLDAVTDAHTGY
jgi:hypothetical protein